MPSVKTFSKGGYNSTNTVQKRRAFLVNFAALPILTSFANNAYARDDGKLVYGG